MGGTSSINCQALIPPSASDLDAWEKIGNAGWNWEVMAPYIQKPFTIHLPDEETQKHLSISWAEKLAGDSKGPIKASFPGVKEDPIGKAWVETFEGLGYSLSASPFSGKSIGPYNGASTIDPTSKTRFSSSTGYYLPIAGRPNLKVFLNSVTEKVLLERSASGEEPRASGVQIVHDGAKLIVQAKKEVIVSAGVFNSPKILELSGIGDPDILQPHGIDVQVANPCVGSNLQDHMLCALSFEARDGIYTGDDLMRKDPSAIQFAMNLYQKHQAGPFTSTGITSFGYLPTIDFVHNPEDLDAALKSLSKGTLSHPLDSARLGILRNLLEHGKEGTAQYFLFPAQSSSSGKDTTTGLGSDPQPGNFISLVVALSHPLSSGTSHISSADVSASPIIDHHYLEKPLDLEMHARHVRFLENIAAAEPFASLLKPDGRRNNPTAFINGDLEKAKEYVKSSSTTNWHSVGTCAMAPKDKGGVVDKDLKVYGVKGLRVVDASIFPFVPQSNTQSLVYAVAERASDIIKQTS